MTKEELLRKLRVISRNITELTMNVRDTEGDISENKSNEDIIFELDNASFTINNLINDIGD